MRLYSGLITRGEARRDYCVGIVLALVFAKPEDFKMFYIIQSLKVIAMLILFTHAALCVADNGPGGTGGGDEYTLDFVQTATQQIYPWLKAHGNSLVPKVNADDFLMTTNPENIISEYQVFESCDGSNGGREVEACFNSITNKIHLSRTLYPLNIKNSSGKLGLVAHEIFRKMKLEGDKYEITRQLSIVAIPGNQGQGAALLDSANQSALALDVRSIGQGSELIVNRDLVLEKSNFLSDSNTSVYAQDIGLKKDPSTSEKVCEFRTYVKKDTRLMPESVTLKKGSKLEVVFNKKIPIIGGTYLDSIYTHTEQSSQKIPVSGCVFLETGESYCERDIAIRSIKTYRQSLIVPLMVVSESNSKKNDYFGWIDCNFYSLRKKVTAEDVEKITSGYFKVGKTLLNSL